MDILIIDDHQSITGMFSKYLTMKGHQVTVSNDSKEGLKSIFHQKFDFVLLDLNMPEFSGLDIINELEKKGKLRENNIVLFTASDISDTEITRLKTRGVKGALRKPVILEDLHNMILKLSQPV
jgi:CheY-like chemotaxis protein